jgi:hypothetical protein
VKPKRRAESHFDSQNKADDHMADNDNREVGRGIIGTMMVKGFATMRTVIAHLQIAREKRADAACWTF